MTREELIKQAANKYMDNYVPDICGMCEEDIWDAFIAGAKWANKYPDFSQVWHDPSEEPQGDEWKILCQNNLGKFPKMTRKKILIFYPNSGWKGFVNLECITRWAYLSDLLPQS